VKITDAFAAEHAVLNAQFDYLEKVVPIAKTLAEIKAMAGLLDAALSTHAHLEDELLFHGLEGGLDQLGQLEKVQHEHDAICKGLAKVQSSLRRSDAQRRLLNIIHLTRKEFELEERVIFKMAGQMTRAENLTKLTKAWAKHRMVTVT